MFESVLCIKYVSFKTCFVYLSSKHKDLNTGIYIKLTYGDNRVAYFSASVVQNNVDIESIGINSSYAKVLGINENDFVNVSQIEQLPVINNISIQPFTKSDYEVLEILSQNVQSNLLDQVRVVSSGQSLLIWIGNSISVKVFVENVHPISPGILDFLTEVVIKPPDISGSYSIKDKDKVNKNAHNIEEFIQFIKQNSNQDKNIKSETGLSGWTNFKIHEDLYFRLIPLSELPETKNKLKNVSPFAVFVSKKSHYKTIFEKIMDCCFYNMAILNSPYFEKKLHVKLCFLEDLFTDPNDVFVKNNSFNIFVNDSIINFMQCEFGARVVLKKVEKIPIVKEIEVHSKKNYAVNVIEKVKIYLSDNSKTPFILNADFPIEIDNKLYCSLKFLPGSNEFCVTDDEFLRNCSYTLCNEEVRPLETTLKKCDFNEKFCMDILPAKEACDKVISIFCVRNEYYAENVILTGGTGMGKSSFLDHVAKILRNYPYFINTEIVNCKKIKGKTVDSLQRFFTEIFAKLIFCQPSLLLLDDLNVLCEHCEGDETPNTVYFNRVSEMLYGLFSSLSTHNSIGILASAESVSKLNKNIYRSRGNYLFKNVVTIADLNKADRILLLKRFFKKHVVSPDLDYNELSIKTDGFVIQDMEDLYKKILFEAHKEIRLDRVPTIKQDYCNIALQKSCALSLQNVKFHSTGSKSFEDIGGLHNVKRVLIESLLWPVKYSAIFAKAPLRLQSGLLLYGPPGTGKTLLAGAAAKQCSLRLISIKGPELLSKYIGASEQAVRDVFEKAQRAKPCILFFDEFDSLAPRRGHDNTGVTDRVVNQLLTQLDGVEALTGVCVLAATSRPDLLDPALLRPGRLDKKLMCPMPNQADRLEILKTLSTGLDLSDDADLNEIAVQTEGYSGADLHSVLYTCQVSSIKDFEDADRMDVLKTLSKRLNLSEDLNEIAARTDGLSIAGLKTALYEGFEALYPEEPDLVTSKISHNCLLAALKKTRPSLTQSERIKYERIYARFEGGNVEDFRAGSKVTLA